MGTFVYTQGPVQGGQAPAVSRGGVRFCELLSKGTMGATYATGGDTVTLPTAPDGFSLWAVEIIAHNAGAGIDLVWDQSTSTPKILAYDEDNASGIAAELSNGSAALAAVVVYLRLIYEAGI